MMNMGSTLIHTGRYRRGAGPARRIARKYRHHVLMLSMGHMRNRADAEDAAQETFMKAYWGLHHFRGDSEFFSWLYSIAVISARTALLLRARRSKGFAPACRNADEQNENSAQHKETSSPAELASAEEICRAVNRAIEVLVDEQRTAIVLREFQGLTYRQVASVMSCPIGTVRSRIFRAREAIDARLHRIFDNGQRRPRRDGSLRSWQIEAMCSLER